MRRRQLLHLAGGTIVGLAGCLFGSDEQTPTAERSDTSTRTPTPGTPTAPPASTATKTDSPTPTDVPSGVPDDVPSPTGTGRPGDAVAWTYATGADVQYPVSVADDTVYVPSDALYALSTAGRERWASEAGPTEATPVVRDESVVTLLSADVDAGRGMLAVDQDGGELWRFTPDERINYLADGGGNVYASSYGHLGSAGGRRLYAVDATTGEQRWRAEVGYPTETVVVEDTVVNASPGAVRAFDARDGTKLWQRSIPAGGYDSIAGVHDGAVILSAGYALSASDGRTRWQHDGTGALLADGLVFDAIERDDAWQLAALDATTGREQWRSRAIDDSIEPLVRRADLVLAGSGIDDGLVAFSAADGTITWAWDRPSNVWDAGRVGDTFLVTHGRWLYAVDAAGTEWWSYRASADFSGVLTTETAAFLGDRSGTVHAIAPP